MSPQSFDCKVSFDPFKESFYLSSVSVDISYLQGAYIRIIADKFQFLVILQVIIFD